MTQLQSPSPSPQRLSMGNWGLVAGVVGRKLLQAALTMLAISLLSFLLMQLAPGDFLSQRSLSTELTEELIAAERARLGLDRPIYMQYLLWLGNLLRVDLGVSYAFHLPVSDLIFQRAGATLLLAIASLLGTWALAVPLGILSALKQNTWVDRLLQLISYTGQAMPSFVLAILLLFVAQNVSGLPVGGMTSIDFDQLSWWGKVRDIVRHLLLPTLVLSITGFAGLQRITRGSFLDILRQDYIQSARAKGLSETRIIIVHALRNAINPLITILGFEFSTLLSGSFIAEFFFNWPGLGRLLLDAVRSFDINVVMAGLLLGSLMLIIGNFLADLALQYVDPRIRIYS
ncbi:MAG: ABC transporter permease [Cyanobacteria bacterium P01_G01_bin.4]